MKKSMVQTLEETKAEPIKFSPCCTSLVVDDTESGAVPSAFLVSVHLGLKALGKDVRHQKIVFNFSRVEYISETFIDILIGVLSTYLTHSDIVDNVSFTEGDCMTDEALKYWTYCIEVLRVLERIRGIS